LFSRANRAAPILPSMPRLPKPPGTRIASYFCSWLTLSGVIGLGVEVVDLHAHVVLQPGVAQRLVQRLVAVRQVDVLADHGDLHFALRMLHLVHQVVPALEVGRRRVQAQLVADQAVQALLVQHAGTL
jgi:hypothetical protein